MWDVITYHPRLWQIILNYPLSKDIAIISWAFVIVSPAEAARLLRSCLAVRCYLSRRSVSGRQEPSASVTVEWLSIPSTCERSQPPPPSRLLNSRWHSEQCFFLNPHLFRVNYPCLLSRRRRLPWGKGLRSLPKEVPVSTTLSDCVWQPTRRSLANAPCRHRRVLESSDFALTPTTCSLSDIPEPQGGELMWIEIITHLLLIPHGHSGGERPVSLYVRYLGECSYRLSVS